MGHDELGNVAITGSKTLTGVMTAVMTVMIIGCFMADHLFPAAAGAETQKVIHNSVNTGSSKYGTWGSDYTCATCHNRSALDNIKYINYTIATPTGKRRVIFDRYTTTSNAVTGVFGNDERTVYKNGSRNICEVCHHRTIYHNYSVGKLSNIVHAEHGQKGSSNRRDCNGCHQHSTGYKAPQIGQCDGCHGVPPTSPETMVYQSFTLGLDPPADAGAHNRHRNIEQMECYTCHNNYGHGILNGNDMIEIGFRIDRRTWKGFSGISTVMGGTYTGTIGPPFTNTFAVAPGNPNTTLLREPGVNSCSVYCHGDGWAVPSGKAFTGQISWVYGSLGSCSVGACHGTSAANPPNPNVPGAHTRHVKDVQQDCDRCHPAYTSPHMINGRIAWDLTLQGQNASYKGFKIHSTATLPGVAPYGDCANIYCHSNVQPNGGTGSPDIYKTATWGSSVQLTCDGCHGGKTTDASPIQSGAHTKHISAYGYACNECHNGYGSDGSLMTHLDNNIEVAFNVYSGAYSQMPLNEPGKGYGSCSANYCHSDAKGSKKIIAWGATGPLPCDACHKADQPGNAVGSGKHTAHVDNGAFLGSNYGCVVCHANTVVDNSHLTTDRSRHVNKYGDYSGARAGRYDRTTGTCAISYCHSDGKDRAPAVAVSWTDGSVINDCKGCHGVAPDGTFVSAAGEPNYANTGMDTTFANSHDRHMGGVGVSTCVYCHNDTVSTTGLKTGTLHLNGTKNIAPGGGKSFTYLGNRACANISCHGGPAEARWGQKFAADCTGCHGNNAVSFSPISSGKHKLHMNNAAFLGKNYPCATCHALTAKGDDRGIVDTSVHGNGFKNYTGPLAGSRSSYTTADGVCSASYCHTDGKEGRNVTFTSLNGWKSAAASLGCTGCHGNNSPADFTSAYGEPNYASTGSGMVRANDHKNHVDNGRYSCASCHGKTVDANGAIFSSNSTHILNRKIDVQAGNGKSFDYNEQNKTCSGISCHGGKGSFSKTWGDMVTADCTGCHGNNYLSFAPISSGRHKAHMNNAATLGANYNCTECHAKTINSDERSFADRTRHGNGFVDYSGIRAGGSGSYDPAQGNCSATYCHTDGKGRRNVFFTPATGWNSKTTYGNCIGCHGNDSTGDFAATAGEPNYVSEAAGSLRANSHKVHVKGGAASCYNCHADVVGVGGGTVNGRHINRYISYSTSGTPGKTFSRGTGKTCSNIACHGVTAVTATWGGTLSCTGCHGGIAAEAPNDIKTGRHTAHINNPDMGSNLACAACHGQVVNGDTAFIDRNRHADGFVDYSGAMAGNNKASCNLAYCHSNGKGVAGNVVDWAAGTAFVNCIGCHGTATGSGTFPSQAGEPNYANTGLAGSATSNSHQTHTTGLTWKGADSCSVCHLDTVTTAGTQIKANSLHLDRSIDVFFDPVRVGSAGYDKINRTCNNTSCHGSPAPKWGDAASVSCKTCHAGLMSSGAHAAHVGSDLWSTNFATMYNYTSNNSVGIMYRYGCANCHPVETLTYHRNGTYGDMDLSSNAAGIGSLRKLNRQILAAGTGYTKNGTTSFTCDLVYCHSDGRDTVNPTYRPSPNWYGGPFTGNKCAMCHDNPPRYAGQSHYVASSSMGKESGHMIGIHYRNNSKGNNRNGFLGFSSSGSVAHGNSAVATTIGCNICHSGIVGSTKVDTYAMSGTSSIFNCSSCHKTDSRTPLQAGEITNTALHVNGAKDVAFAPIDFKTKAQLSVAANALGWTRNGDYKADDSYDHADLRVSTWMPETKTCYTACHVNQPNITWGGQLQCVSCHVNQ